MERPPLLDIKPPIQTRGGPATRPTRRDTGQGLVDATKTIPATIEAARAAKAPDVAFAAVSREQGIFVISVIAVAVRPTSSSASGDSRPRRLWSAANHPRRVRNPVLAG